ncbi:MAG: hypothetical protein NVSMB56_19480 [Pyrinomonadaceae bacterium]
MASRINNQIKKSPQSEKRNVIRDSTPTFDEQLSHLDEDIRRLKVESDIYFNGATKRPPYDTKNRVETQIKRLADERQLTFAQRYRYNSLIARFTSFREMWRRTLQGREEGRDAASIKLAALERARAEETAAESSKAERSQVKPPNRSFVCADVRHDVPTVKNLYDALIDAKRHCGESSDELTFARFHRIVAEQSESLKQRLNCERIRFSIRINEGRVNFKAEAEKKG